MKILSKFRDYYDSVLAYGTDSTIYYNRETTTIPLEKSITDALFDKRVRPYLRLFSIEKADGLYFSLVVIGFCGKLYPYYKITRSPHRTIALKAPQYLCTVKELEKLYEKCKIKTRELYDKKSLRYSTFKAEELVHNLSTFNSQPNFLCDLFVKYKVPVFILESENKIVLNPNLSNYNFYKTIDTFTAFQSIEQYVSGVLGGSENYTIELKDKDKIKKHGFDSKSFRAQTGDKKPRKSNKNKL